MAALPPPTLSRHPVDVGRRTEAVIIGELVRRGYRVLVPFGHNHRYDLVIDLGDRFLRVQCKTGRYRSGVVEFATVSTRSSTTATYRRGYRGEIDLFAVFCPGTGRIYAVSVEEAVDGIHRLRVDPPRNRQAKKIRWAADYELPA